MDCGSRHRGTRAPRVLNPEVLDSGRRATNVDRPGPIDLISGVVPVAYAPGEAVDAPSTPQLGSPTTLLRRDGAFVAANTVSSAPKPDDQRGRPPAVKVPL